MTKVILEINTSQVFESVDSARAAGIAVDSALGSHVGSIKVIEVPGFKPHSLRPDLADSTQFTYGGQIIDGRLAALVKRLKVAIPAIADADINEGVKVLDGKNWTISYQQLLNNISEHVDRVAARAAFDAAVAETLAAEALRGIK